MYPSDLILDLSQPVGQRGLWASVTASPMTLGGRETKKLAIRILIPSPHARNLDFSASGW